MTRHEVFTDGAPLTVQGCEYSCIRIPVRGALTSATSCLNFRESQRASRLLDYAKKLGLLVCIPKRDHDNGLDVARRRSYYTAKVFQA